MSEPTPPSPAPPSAPTPPGQDPSPNGRSDRRTDGEAPVEVRRARNLYTVVAAFLVFIGVTSLMGISEAAVEFRRALNEADPTLSEQFSTGMIKALLVLTAIATLMVAVGHGLTSHAIDGRRSWSRPLGLTFSGILLGLAALNLFSGAQIMPAFFFAIAGLLGISLLGRPEVRDYLKPRWAGPGGGPPGPGGPPSPPGPGGYPPAPGQHPNGTPGQHPNGTPGQHPNGTPGRQADETQQLPWMPQPGQIPPPPTGQQPGPWTRGGHENPGQPPSSAPPSGRPDQTRQGEPQDSEPQPREPQPREPQAGGPQDSRPETWAPYPPRHPESAGSQTGHDGSRPSADRPSGENHQN